MTALVKLACAVAVGGLGAVAIAGCGNTVPGNAVAKVGDSVITKADFDKWLKTAASGQAQGGEAIVPDPPEFTSCVAAKREQPQPGGAERQQGEGQLKRQCEQEYEQLKSEVMQFLIQARWVQQEAEEQDVNVSQAEVRRSFEDQKNQAFPNEKAYREFLQSSGMTEEDILFRVRLDTLQNKLTQKVTEDEGKVSDEDVREYYDNNKRRFAQPERRDLRVVLTRTEARANEAKSALDDGRNWRQVAREFSIDEASKSQGGRLPDVAKGQQEKALDEAVFAARRGQIRGPVKTQFGWYVFEVTDVTQASQQSFEDSEDTIRQLLRSQRQEKALDDFIKDFREEYKERTDCADDYEVAECSNAEEGTDTGPASGGAPGGQAAPQGAPAPEGAPPAPQGEPQGTPPPAPPQQP